MKRAFAIALLVLVAGCGGSGGGGARAAAVTGSHIVVIVMENKEHGQVIGSRSAPYVTSLAHRYAAPTRIFGVRHPSLPNYFALTSGATLVHSDCTGCQQSARSIVDQLEEAGLSWKAYMQGMPRPCFKGAFHGVYAKKHNPFMYYRRVADNPRRCANVVPAGRLDSDLRKDRLPTFAWLTPGLCADTHDCSVAAGDRYLRRVVPPLLKALGPDGFLVLTWDEGTSSVHRGGRIPTVIAGPQVTPGAHPSTVFDHYSTLATIEDALALPRLGNAGAATPLDAAFVQPPRLR